MLGLLLDSLSENTGDMAIQEVMVDFLRARQQEFSVLSPFDLNNRQFRTLIVGGGHLIRPLGDLYYDCFRVNGPHILNTVGVSTTEDLDYLGEYIYVTVRSTGDLARVSTVAPNAQVYPCVSLTLRPAVGPALTPKGCIGFHFHSQSWAEAGDEKIFRQFANQKLCFIPITFYNQDYKILQILQSHICSSAVVLPKFPPRIVLRELGNMSAIVCSSLHAAIFAYSQNIPFLVFGKPKKIVEFMKDRGLQFWIFNNPNELRTKLELLLNHPPDYTLLLRRDLVRIKEHFRMLGELLSRNAVYIGNIAVRVPPADHKLLMEHNHRLSCLERTVEGLLTRSSLALSDLPVQGFALRGTSQALEFSRSLQADGIMPNQQQNVELPLGTVESPPFGAVIVNTCDLSGWALSKVGTAQVAVYIDGRLARTVTERRVSRPDVAKAYPDFPENGMAGYVITVDASDASPGPHEFVIQARTSLGACRDIGVLTLIKLGDPEKDSVKPRIRNEEQALESTKGTKEGELPQWVSSVLREHEIRLSQLKDAIDNIMMCLNSKDNASLSATAPAYETEQRIEELKSQFLAIRDNLASMRHSPCALEDRVGADSSIVSCLKTDLSSLSNSFNEFQRNALSEISTLRNALHKLESEVTKISHQSADSSATLASISSDVAALYNSRIWRTLKLLARPFDSVTRVALAVRAQKKTPVDKSIATHCESDKSQFPFESILRVGIDYEIPEVIDIGRGSLIAISGCCYHPESEIRKLEIAVNSVSTPVTVHGFVRPDVYNAALPPKDKARACLGSGFFVMVPLHTSRASENVAFDIIATLRNANRCSERLRVSRLRSEPKDRISPMPRRGSIGPDRLIAVCMTTYNPTISLFSRQIESLKAQTYTNWICLISDDCSLPSIYEDICAAVKGDERFRIERLSEHKGFYENFEHALSMVPEEADFIALCDQDDFWYPEKLETLVSNFCYDEVTLVYSDMNIVDISGRVLSRTYWTTRRNNYTNLMSLLIANTVTGASCMFRSWLLDLILPFPRTPGIAFHDHWIACVALSVGRISYVSRPLYDYVQHSQNVIGHFAPPTSWSFRNAWLLVKNLAGVKKALEYWRTIYFGDVIRIQMLAAMILIRGGELISAKKQRILRRVSRLDSSLCAPLLLFLRTVRRLWRGNETVGAETRLLRGLMWRRLVPLERFIAYRSALRSSRNSSPNSLVGSGMSLAKVRVIQEKIAPLNFCVSSVEPWRVNLLVPTIDLDYVFGGYLAKFNLALRLAESGLRVRILVTDYCAFDPSRWAKQLKEFEGLEQLFQNCEVDYAYDRGRQIPRSPRDVFVATTWWTAHLARAAVVDRGFIYLIQEFEPFTFPMGSFSALAAETYNWPHYSVFSTSFLREHFCREGLGVYRRAAHEGDSRSVVFLNAITDVKRPSVETLASRSSRRLLFYARPEEHAARNMFEMGVLALCRSIEEGTLPEDWDIDGIGAVSSDGRIPLARGRFLRLLRRQTQRQYGQLLSNYDLGLSLMYTPHVSLVPIEMAAAGLVVVTNTYGCKTSDKLKDISGNIVGVEPTIDALRLGIAEAVGRVENFSARVEGSSVRWPRSWREALNDDVISRIVSFVKALSTE